MILAPVIRLLSAWKAWMETEKAWMAMNSQPEPEEWVPLVLGIETDLAGEVTQILKEGKAWRVKYTATFWLARSEVVLHLKLGDEVRVIGRKGGALLIEPLDKAE